MERNQRDRGGQPDQSQQRDKLQGGSKGDAEQDRTRRATEKKQGGGQQGGGQGIDRDLPRRGSEEQNFDLERQSGTPGRRSEQGPGQTGSPRQPGVGEPGRTVPPGQRST